MSQWTPERKSIDDQAPEVPDPLPHMPLVHREPSRKLEAPLEKNGWVVPTLTEI